MATAKWKVTLEFECDDGEGDPTKTVISQTGDWQSGGHQRAANESVAITMSSIMAMLLECGAIVAPSDFEGSCSAFSGD